MTTERADTFVLDEEYHSPARAAMLSAALPGLGQIYNKKYWKLPILYGGTAGLIFGMQLSNNRYKMWRQAYYDAKLGDFFNDEIIEYFDDLNIDLTQYTIDKQINTFERNKDTWKKRRDYYVLGLAGIYLLNIVDAHVDAYFLNFDVSEDLTLKIDPFVDKSLLSENIIGVKLSIDYK